MNLVYQFFIQDQVVEISVMMCDYFQAHIPVEHVWFVTAIIRGYEHVAFDRTIDVHKSIFEFFVPRDMREIFLDLMQTLQQKNLIADLQELPNRLLTQPVLFLNAAQPR